jgi:hypothetical protein
LESVVVAIRRDGTQLNLTRNYRDKLDALLVRPGRPAAE